ncbi:hypothetical protein LZ318_15750 [Saccharopolyspora indica]|uniref:hypothetical protein n=1 Tax=Saccharopolyspora indica TaxID=1229659 RepID=UPI0022EB8F17|nr:hypothetical protein [Saccharopolyspora indica]MDA3645959.1 hypothetical protein [Saccharopolyspora indica]
MRRSTLGFLSALTVSAVLGSAAPPATADGAGVTCTGTDTTTYDPPVSAVPQHVKVSIRGTYPLCSSNDPALTSATTRIEGSGVLSCGEGKFRGDLTIRWNDGRESSASGGRGIHHRQDDHVFVIGSGKIIGGALQGHEIRRVVSMSHRSCATGPVSESQGEVVLRLQPR